MSHIIKFDISTLPTTFCADYGYCNSNNVLHVDRIANCHVLLFILSGCMPVTEDGTEYFLKPGDIFFLKKGIHHWGETYFSANTSWCYIHFNLEDPDINIPELSPDFIHKKHVDCTAKDYKKILTLPKCLHNILGTDIELKIKKMVELFSSPNPYLLAYLNSFLHELLTDIYMYGLSEQNKDSAATRTHQIYSYLSQNIHKPFSTSDIERFSGLSYKYICDIFKKETGMTIHKCMENMKIEYAIRKLCSTNDSISRLSESLGYSDPLYFSNVFKKNTGMSPKTYRKKYSNRL